MATITDHPIDIINREMNTLPIYDIHSHILPEMDDGSKSAEMSVKMMMESGNQGVQGIVFTPHYYPQESVRQFLQRRRDSYWTLQEYILTMPEELKLPEMCLGAEVAYRNGICKEERIRDLCIGRSDYLLLEMPFKSWTSDVFREVELLQRTAGIKLIIAHLERYFHLESRKQIENLLDLDVLIQMNAGAFDGLSGYLTSKKMISNGITQVMGSDCHNLTNRAPNLGQTICKYQNRIDFTEILENNRMIFESAN